MIMVVIIMYSSFRNSLIVLLSVILSAFKPARRAAQLTFSTMDLSVENLNRLEKELSLAMNDILKISKTEIVTQLNHSRFMGVNKDPLATAVENFSKQMTGNIELYNCAASTNYNRTDQTATEKTRICPENCINRD